MALITDNEAPPDVPTTNALDNIDTGEEERPAAYLKLGTTPCAVENAPEQGEFRTYIVRTRCSEEHGPLERKDGEMRFERKLEILSIHEEGTNPVVVKGGLFSVSDQSKDESEGGDE